LTDRTDAGTGDPVSAEDGENHHPGRESESLHEPMDRTQVRERDTALLRRKCAFSMLVGSAILLVSNTAFTVMTNALAGDLAGVLFMLAWTLLFFLAGLWLLRQRTESSRLPVTPFTTGVLAMLGLAYHGAMICGALCAGEGSCGDTNLYSGIFWPTQGLSLTGYAFILRGVYLLHHSRSR